MGRKSVDACVADLPGANEACLREMRDWAEQQQEIVGRARL